jgi:capsular polysaccharide export protein
MANYLFIRGSRNKRFFIDIAKELKDMGHQCYLIKLELGELLFKSNINTTFAPLWVKKKEYPISDEELLEMPIYNITYMNRILKKDISPEELSTYKKYMYFIDEFIIRNKIDIICLFNGYHWIDQVTKYIARKRGLKVYHFEDGLFRPYTVTCDPKGINALASVSRDPDFYDSIIVDEGRLKKYLFKPETPLLLKKKKESLVMVALVKSLSMLGSFIGLHPSYYAHITLWQAIKYFIFKKTFTFRKNDPITLPEEYVFVPFQVSRDTQIFYNSPHISNMEEFLDYVYKAIVLFNKETGRNLKIIVKEHPEDMSRNNYKHLKKKYENVKEVIFVQKYNIHHIINNCEAVITINSTVGIEALARNKRVITLGEALYNIEGIVEKCNDPSTLHQSLYKSLNTPINTERIKKFIYYLRFYYQVEGTISVPSKQTAVNVAKRISE